MIKLTRTRDNHTSSDKPDVNKMLTAQQMGYESDNKDWKLKPEFRTQKDWPSNERIENIGRNHVDGLIYEELEAYK